MFVVKRVESQSQPSPKENAEEKDGLVAEEFVALVEDEKQLSDDPQKEKGYKDCHRDDDSQMDARFNGHDAMAWEGCRD